MFLNWLSVGSSRVWGFPISSLRPGRRAPPASRRAASARGDMFMCVYYLSLSLSIYIYIYIYIYTHYT